MRLLIDTDVFCKLGVAGLLDAALAALGVALPECARLAALPHMLRRGKLPRLYGIATCETLAARAETIAVMPDPPAKWLDLLAAVTDVDPGEAQIFAVAAQHRISLLTGDKRALRAVATVAGFPGALEDRVITFEAVLLRMCETMDNVHVRAALSLLGQDQVVRVCFSPGSPDPKPALRSYQNSLQNELRPLLLWNPAKGRIE
jgi:hypothetical protein